MKGSDNMKAKQIVAILKKVVTFIGTATENIDIYPYNNPFHINTLPTLPPFGSATRINYYMNEIYNRNESEE